MLGGAGFPLGSSAEGRTRREFWRRGQGISPSPERTRVGREVHVDRNPNGQRQDGFDEAGVGSAELSEEASA